MRRLVVVALTALVAVAVSPVQAGAAPVPKPLLNDFQRALLGTTESDPWLFDDGCIGGHNQWTPMHIIVPNTDPPTTVSDCTVRLGAPVVIVPAGYTCWQPTWALARDECETFWNDPATVLEASVTVDGRSKAISETTVSGRFTFPEGAVLEAPGTAWWYYSISAAVVLTDLRPGVHEILVAYLYADGFVGDTTFSVTVTRGRP